MRFPVNHVLQNPNGTWGFVGNVDARLAFTTKDGGMPTQKQMEDAKIAGPGIVGLKSRVWGTVADAVADAFRLGCKVTLPKSSKRYFLIEIQQDKDGKPEYLLKESGWTVDRLHAWAVSKYMDKGDASYVSVKLIDQ